MDDQGRFVFARDETVPSSTQTSPQNESVATPDGVQPTSRAAYEELRDSLKGRQAVVLRSLERYRRQHGVWPTAYELFEAMKAEGLVADINGTRPRLTELKEQGLVENQTIKRHCGITAKRAFTWALTTPPELF